MRYTAEQLRELIAAGGALEFYRSYEWRTLAPDVIKSEHRECRMCRAEHRLTRATTAHHIKPLKAAPELAYERDNLMPLCHDCHEKIHERGIYSKRQGFVNE